MPVWMSDGARLNEAFGDNTQYALAQLARLRELEQRTRDASARAAPVFEKRGQLLPRERVGLLLDPGAPFLELSTLAGYRQDHADDDRTVPGGGMVCGIGWISGVRVMLVADDSGIDAGALQPMGIPKFQRAQQIALQNFLPFVHLVESAGANLFHYRVEDFIHGGGNFYNLARLSAAGIPVVTIVHGSSTAGGAYMPGLSDYVVMVRGRAKAFLAGPPLLKAATGEIATDEELGGAELHAATTGLSEYLAEDDAHALGIAREVLASLDWNRDTPRHVGAGSPPLLDAEELLGLFGPDQKKPVDMREVIARLTDGSEFLEFKAAYGSATICGHGSILGRSIGFITNNGPLDPAGATKVVHFIQACCQTDVPLVFLQNTTGFMVGRQSEREGMIKHGSKMIQAVSNATVPKITIMCNASFGAGNYGMCGRSFGPSFVFSWPHSRTGIMGAEQAAGTMVTVTEAGLRRRGKPVDADAINAMRDRLVETFERQTPAFYTSGLLLDDGVIDPRDTRRVLATVLDVCDEARRRPIRPIQFAVARP
jgi:geranyl-CoA carboxylase beta subunit